MSASSRFDVSGPQAKPAVETAPLRIVVRPECLRESAYRLVEIPVPSSAPADLTET
ncbi:hypothetical protein AB0L13_10380 [Saccharopolyspora shandongensis]|uniref:hypothetical protein n=1 Tax=Saccharopolyspora shandongensis TaxID=418495 RepID=UPI00343A49CA